MPDREITVGELLLLEYEGIKEEQRGRIAFRDNLLYATLASMAAVIVAVLQARDQPALLLLLPPVSLVLGWSYLVNDEKVSAIGQYIRTDLGPRLAELLPADTAAEANLFGWETAHRSDHRRISRKALQLAVDVMMFGLSPLVALVIFWLRGHGNAPTVAVSVLEAGGIVLLVVQLVLYADLRR